MFPPHTFANKKGGEVVVYELQVEKFCVLWGRHLKSHIATQLNPYFKQSIIHQNEKQSKT